MVSTIFGVLLDIHMRASEEAPNGLLSKDDVQFPVTIDHARRISSISLRGAAESSVEGGVVLGLKTNSGTPIKKRIGARGLNAHSVSS